MTTEKPAAPKVAAPKADPGAGQLLVDLGPILVFVISYALLNRVAPGEAIYVATGLFIFTTLMAIFYCWRRTGRIPPVLLVTGVLVTAFGGLTIALHDPTFVKLKPTVVYVFFATAIFGSLLVGQNIWKLLFRHAFALPDPIWTILAVRWGCFFVVLAIINEVIRRTQTTEIWVYSKLAVFALTLVFALANAPLMMKHMEAPKESEEAPKS